MHFKLAFIGYGTVGQGLTEILLEKKDLLAEKFDFNWKIVAVSDITKGSVYDKNGLDMKQVLDLVKQVSDLSFHDRLTTRIVEDEEDCELNGDEA